MDLAGIPSVVRTRGGSAPDARGFPASRHAGAGTARLLGTWLGRLAFAILVVFHVWLFWTHWSSGRLFEATVAFRWLFGAGLAGGFLALRRLGAPLLWGRKAVGLWLLVVLLHCHAAVAPNGVLPAGATFAEAVAVFVLQAATGASVLALGLAVFAALAGRRARPAQAAWWLASMSPVAAGVGAGPFLRPFAPRPPPLA